MANETNMLPLPEGAVEIPIEAPTEQETQVLAVPQGGVEVQPQVPTVGGEMLRGAIQGWEERGGGLELAIKDAKAIAQGTAHFFNKISELAPSDEDLMLTKKERDELYNKISTNRAYYEATMSVMPEGVLSRGPTRVGEIAGSAIYDVPLSVVTGGRSAAGRLWASMMVGAAAGATLPAKDEEERGRNAMLGAAFGGTGTIGFEAARINANILARHLNKALDIPEIAKRYEQSAALTQMTGIDYTTSQATGSRVLAAYENMAADATSSADEVLQYRGQQLGQAVDYVKRTIDKLGDSTVDSKVVGQQLKDGLLKSVDELTAMRSHNWDQFMNKATVASGNKPIGIPSKTSAKLDEILDELKHPVSGYPPAVIKQFEKLKSEASKSWTVRDFQMAMKTWGRNAAGTSQPFEALAIADQKRIYRDALNAMREDLDNIAAKGGLEGDAAKNLNLARESWKNYSGQIDELENTVLGTAIDKSGRPLQPEELYSKIRKMPGSELERLAPLMDSVDPKIMNNVRARIFNDAYEQAVKDVDPTLALTEFNPATFVRELSKTPNADIIFAGAPMKEYQTAILAINRLTKGIGEGAAASPAQTMGKVGALGGGALENQGLPNMIFLQKFLVEHLTGPRYARLLMTPEGRNAVITLSKGQKVGRQAINASVGTLVGFLTSPNTLEETPQEPSPIQGQVTVE